MKYHFYKCVDERFAPKHDFFDHSHGIVGFKRFKTRAGYMGHLTIDELDKMLSKPKHLVSSGNTMGRSRSGYANVTKQYSSRF